MPVRDLAKLTAAIEGHLESHPQAADSVEGVALWWLGGMAASAQEVECALEGLVQRRRMRCVTLADGTSLYSRASGSAGGGVVGRRSVSMGRS